MSFKFAHIQQTLSGPVPSKFRKAWTVEAKAAWDETARVWHRRYRDKRFTHEGAREYKFTRRSGMNLRGANRKRYKRTYSGRKESKFGHTLPNVWSGLSRRLAKQIVTRPKSKGVRIPLAMTARYPIPNSQINQLREYRAVSEREQTFLTKDHDRRINKRLKSFRQSTTKKAR